MPVRWLTLALTVSGWVSGQSPATAQQSVVGRGVGSSVGYPYGASNAGGAVARSAPAAGMYGNPYAVPTMNPFLNPYASLYAPASPQNAALYFFAAQQSMGGIGSGQLSGTRPRPGPAPVQASPIPDDRRVSDTPGAGAARYFNRPVKGGGVPNSHYNRFGNYYSANGH
jgi:hypothetical protein